MDTQLGIRFDLKKACKHCPFVTTKTRITFACRERAEEIAETAYREGFVCHQHAEYEEDDEGDGGYVFNHDGTSQHCFGALAMHVRNGDATIPWEIATELDPDLEKRWWDRVADTTFADIFDSEEAFLEANTNAQD